MLQQGVLRLVRTLVASVRTAPRARSELPAAPDARLLDATCLDVRPPSSLSAGIVRGAWIVPAAEAPRFASLWTDVIVLGDPAVATALRAHGVRATSIASIAAWKAAGREVHEPAWKSPLPPGVSVRYRGELGWVQDVRWADAQFRFDVRVGPTLTLVRDLTEEALEPIAGRGAAGLGTVV